MNFQSKESDVHLDYIARIFVLVQNPELRLVSKQFYLASKSHFTRVDYLLFKYGRDQFFSSNQGIFKNITKIFSEKTALALLDKIEFEEEKDSELFFYSIANGWNEVVAKILNTFIVKEQKQRFPEESNTSDHVESNTETAGHKASTVAPVIDINKLNGKAIELALKRKHFEAAKLLLRAHKIIPSYTKGRSEPYKAFNCKRADLSRFSRSIINPLLGKDQAEILQLLIGKGESSEHTSTILEIGTEKNNMILVKDVLVYDIGNHNKCFINNALKLVSEKGHVEVGNCFSSMELTFMLITIML
ncbi:hypothetical protein BB560_004480 [Smittium megazygosporum]|uniref:Uncharacterized protein n=1 Tax=Smittium megazygosporum TaxID=133381 RepID=A0A2T9Z948_9FUNG|nr:hypothetical protein BB560_004480 [Smittium megazygosporum]